MLLTNGFAVRCGTHLQALVLHNQVVLQAAYDHVGSVVLQEGDSYTLAFHEPQDAVEFALQVIGLLVAACVGGLEPAPFRPSR